MTRGKKIKSGFVLVCSGYYNKNTVNIVAYKKNKIYFSQFWRVGSSRSRACFLIHRFSHMVEGTRGILGISFIKVPIPFVSSLLLYSDHCRNKPPPSTIHSGDQTSIYQFGRDTNIQFIAIFKVINGPRSIFLFLLRSVILLLNSL